MTKEMIGKECRFATYVPPPEPGMPDMHVIKEIIHYNDGSIQPNVHCIKDHKRNFWVTRKGFQNHKQKKEWEEVNRLIVGTSTQANLIHSCARALGKPIFHGNMRMLSETPYLYGTDISSTALLKKSYQDKYKGFQTKYTVGVFDTETDVIGGTEAIIMASFTFKNRVRTCVVKSFLEGMTNVEQRVQDKMNEYLGDIVKARNITSELFIVNDEVEAIKKCFELIHELKPDFVTCWNIDFDMTKMIDALKLRNIEPKDVFSDPVVPQEYKYFHYKQGKKQKVTASGKATPIKPAAQWHVVNCSSSFTFIDAMCVYKHARIGKPEEQSYSLDNILNKEKIKQKLKFKEADHLEGLAWHQFMQTYHKIEYIIYNRYDCIAIELLDEKTNDLSITLPLFSGCSDFGDFDSQPKRIATKFHFYCLEKGKVFGTTAQKMQTDEDQKVLGLEGWIK